MAAVRVSGTMTNDDQRAYIKIGNIMRENSITATPTPTTTATTTAPVRL
jgi:hypothetical protein